MKILYLVLGFLFLALGALGAMLPILPTVPFLLAASFFLAKSSKRINDWFKSTGLYKKHLERLAKSRTMTLKAKIAILAFASCMLAIAFIFSKPLVARILIVAVLALKYYYFIFKIKTARKQVPQQSAFETIADKKTVNGSKKTAHP